MTKIRTETYSVIIERDPETNRILLEQWRGEEGYLHRLGDKPADIEYSAEFEQLIRQEWRVNGHWHRENDEPAIILYEPKTGKLSEVQYFKMGLEHRDNGPSAITYNPQNGIITRKEWRQRGRYSGGEDYPSVIEYCESTGNPQRLIYGSVDSINRRNGPAIIELDSKSGSILKEHYYLGGEIREPPFKKQSPQP